MPTSRAKSSRRLQVSAVIETPWATASQMIRVVRQAHHRRRAMRRESGLRSGGARPGIGGGLGWSRRTAACHKPANCRYCTSCGRLRSTRNLPPSIRARARPSPTAARRASALNRSRQFSWAIVHPKPQPFSSSAAHGVPRLAITGKPDARASATTIAKFSVCDGTASRLIPSKKVAFGAVMDLAGKPNFEAQPELSQRAP